MTCSQRSISEDKVSFFHQFSKMQIIPIKEFNIQTCFFQFLWFFRLKCWFQGQIIPRIHLILPNAYTQMCFDRNINGNRDVKFLIGIIGHWWKKLTLALPTCDKGVAWGTWRTISFLFQDIWPEKRVKFHKGVPIRPSYNIRKIDKMLNQECRLYRECHTSCIVF